MDTIATIQNLLTCNGSARLVTVALTPSERALIAAAPEMAEALERLAGAFMSHTHWSGEPPVEVTTARALLARIKGES